MSEPRSPVEEGSTSSLSAPVFPFTTTSTALASTSTAPRSTAPINDALAHDFPELAGLSQEDMTMLLEDDACFDAYFNTMHQALELHQAYEQRLKSNIAIAEKNESMRPALEALRTETARLFNEANDLKSRWAMLDEAQTEAFRRFQPPNQLSRLNAATSAQEYLSEQLVNAFLDGGGDDESFARQYREIRKVYHRRAVSLDKWTQGKVVWRT